MPNISPFVAFIPEGTSMEYTKFLFSFIIFITSLKIPLISLSNPVPKIQSITTSLFFILFFKFSNLILSSSLLQITSYSTFIAWSICKLVFEHWVIFSILPIKNTLTSLFFAFSCLAIPSPSPPLLPTPLTITYLSYKSVSKCLTADKTAFSIITISGILYSSTQALSKIFVLSAVPILIWNPPFSLVI